MNTDRRGLLAQRQPAYFNQQAYDDNRPPDRFIWTSKTTLATGLQTAWRPQFAGQLISAKATLQTAGSSQSKFDIFLDGFSIFDSGGLIVVDTSETEGWKKFITRHIYFQANSKMQVNINTVGTSAGGPAILEIIYIRGRG